MAACLSFGCNHDLCCQPGPGYTRNQYTASQCSEACPCIQVRFCFSPARVSLCFSSHLADGLVLSLSVFGCFRVFALLGLAVADRILPISRGSFRVRSSPDISFRDSLACLALGPHRPFVSPVLCGLRLTRLTCLTCSKGICRVCGVLVLFGVWCLCFFWFVCLGFFWFVCGFVSCFPLLLARLSSFTDWCTAHRQQFREQKRVPTHTPLLPGWKLTVSPLIVL